MHWGRALGTDPIARSFVYELVAAPTYSRTYRHPQLRPYFFRIDAHS